MHTYYGCYLKSLKCGVAKNDPVQVTPKAEEKLDGRYLLRTSDATISF